jgi:hypothetical protein
MKEVAGITAAASRLETRRSTNAAAEPSCFFSEDSRTELPGAEGRPGMAPPLAIIGRALRPNDRWTVSSDLTKV